MSTKGHGYKPIGEKMIKLESNMLVLDSSFSKEDVKLINQFILQAEKRTEDRLVKLLEDTDSACSDWAIAVIKGETK
jgi:predicted ATP-dependent Lon-type protease